MSKKSPVLIDKDQYGGFLHIKIKVIKKVSKTKKKKQYEYISNSIQIYQLLFRYFSDCVYRLKIRRF